MEKRYQVFVSSTYQDLLDERQTVIQKLLEIEAIPVGMEYFPAADESAWNVIKQFIAECDYYIVIVAGRYGSEDAEGLSYTEKEYRYAIERGIPVLAFLHSDIDSIPGSKLELSDAGRKKLESFRELCRKKLCKEWSNKDGLGASVVTSMIHLQKISPGVGWVKANQVADEEATKEILHLRRKIDSLENQVRHQRTAAPPGTEDFAQGEDTFDVPIGADAHEYKDDGKSPALARLNITHQFTWNELLAAIGECLIGARQEYDILKELSKYVHRHFKRIFGKQYGPRTQDSSCIHIEPHFISDIVIQFRALGVIEEVFGTGKTEGWRFWRLTEYGDSLFTRLRAIKRSQRKEQLRDG